MWSFKILYPSLQVAHLFIQKKYENSNKIKDIVGYLLYICLYYPLFIQVRFKSNLSMHQDVSG